MVHRAVADDDATVVDTDCASQSEGSVTEMTEEYM